MIKGRIWDENCKNDVMKLTGTESWKALPGIVWQFWDWSWLGGTRGRRVFGSMVAVAFQIAFHAKIHANDVFFIF